MSPPPLPVHVCSDVQTTSLTNAITTRRQNPDRYPRDYSRMRTYIYQQSISTQPTNITTSKCSYSDILKKNYLKTYHVVPASLILRNVSRYSEPSPARQGHHTRHASAPRPPHKSHPETVNATLLGRDPYSSPERRGSHNRRVGESTSDQRAPHLRDSPRSSPNRVSKFPRRDLLSIPLTMPISTLPLEPPNNFRSTLLLAQTRLNY